MLKFKWKHTVLLLLLSIGAFSVIVMACDSCPRTCNSQDSPCPACDLLGPQTCSSYPTVYYGGHDQIIIRDCLPNSGTETCTEDEEMHCYTTYDCLEGSWINNKWCAGTVVAPETWSCETWVAWSCQTCYKTNKQDHEKMDYDCN